MADGSAAASTNAPLQIVLKKCVSMVRAASALTVLSAGIGVALCFRAGVGVSLSPLRRWWSRFGADIFAPILDEWRTRQDEPGASLEQLRSQLAVVDQNVKRDKTVWAPLSSRIKSLEDRVFGDRSSSEMQTRLAEMQTRSRIPPQIMESLASISQARVPTALPDHAAWPGPPLVVATFERLEDRIRNIEQRLPTDADMRLADDEKSVVRKLVQDMTAAQDRIERMWRQYSHLEEFLNSMPPGTATAETSLRTGLNECGASIPTLRNS